MKKYLLCHSSFEPRCLSLVTDLPDLKTYEAVVFGSGKALTERIYQGHHDDLCDLFEVKTGNKASSLIQERGDKVEFLKLLDVQFGKLAVDTSFLVDISTFPRDRLVMLLSYLVQKFSSDNIDLFHCSPEGYATENNDDSAWLAQGVKRVEAIPGFNGIQRTRSQCLVILQLGHERERPQITATSLEPDKVVVIHQSGEQYKNSTCETPQLNNQALLESFESKIVESITNDFDDWRVARDEISRVFMQYNHDYNIFISPNGTKIQLIGALAAALKHPQIQIRYAEPQRYNPDSSFGAGRVWRESMSNILNT